MEWPARLPPVGGGGVSDPMVAKIKIYFQISQIFIISNFVTT